MRRIEGYSLWLGHVGDVADPRGIVGDGHCRPSSTSRSRSRRLHCRAIETYCRFPLIDGTGNPSWLLQAAVETVACLLRSRTSTLVYCSAGLKSLALHRGGGHRSRTGVPARRGTEVRVAIGRSDVSPGLWSEVSCDLHARRIGELLF